MCTPGSYCPLAAAAKAVTSFLRKTSRRYVSQIRNGCRLKKGSFFLNLSCFFSRAGISCRTSQLMPAALQNYKNSDLYNSLPDSLSFKNSEALHRRAPAVSSPSASGALLRPLPPL